MCQTVSTSFLINTVTHCKTSKVQSVLLQRFAFYILDHADRDRNIPCFLSTLVGQSHHQPPKHQQRKSSCCTPCDTICLPCLRDNRQIAEMSWGTVCVCVCVFVYIFIVIFPSSLLCFSFLSCPPFLSVSQTLSLPPLPYLVPFVLFYFNKATLNTVNKVYCISFRVTASSLSPQWTWWTPSSS